MTTVTGFKTEKADAVDVWYKEAKETGMMKILRINNKDDWLFIVSTSWSWNPLLFCVIVGIPFLIFAPFVYLLIPVALYAVIRTVFSGWAIYQIARLALMKKYDYRGTISRLTADDCATVLMEAKRGQV